MNALSNIVVAIDVAKVCGELYQEQWNFFQSTRGFDENVSHWGGEKNEITSTMTLKNVVNEWDSCWSNAISLCRLRNSRQFHSVNVEQIEGKKLFTIIESN